MSSEGRNPPIHMKHRSARVIHMPDTRWNMSDLASMALRFIASSKWATKLSTNSLRSLSGKCSWTAAWSSPVRRWCSSNHLAYSMSNTAAASGKQKTIWTFSVAWRGNNICMRIDVTQYTVYWRARNMSDSNLKGLFWSTICSLQWISLACICHLEAVT